MDLMTWIITFLMFSLCFAIFSYVSYFLNLNRARKSGLYPEKGKATMFDVRRLILKKEKYLAIRLYSEIFNTSLKASQKAVDELERSILEKNIEKQ